MPRPPLNPPFRAEHIGSFFRPPELLEAREASEAGRLPPDQLRLAADAAIRDLVRLHVDLERLAISPQCGFSSSERANKIMSREPGEEKLKRAVAVARRMWPD